MNTDVNQIEITKTPTAKSQAKPRATFKRRIVVSWIRFSRRFRHSWILPVAVVGATFVDGFIFVVPSLILTLTAVTLNHRRWWLYGLCASFGATLNNLGTYYLGRILPQKVWIFLIDWLGISSLWQSAQEALSHYGAYATFLGALIGLPTQLITALIGISDAQASGQAIISLTVVKALSYGFVGQALKFIAFTYLACIGWIKVTKKFEKNEDSKLT